MNQYFFALGTNHSLCKIDIINTLLGKGVEFEILEASEEILIVSVNNELEVEFLINELGSAAKIGKILKENIKEKLEENIEEVLKEELKGGDSGRVSLARMTFGISVYGAGGKLREVDTIFKMTREIKNIGESKRAREGGRILSTVAVDKNGLLPVSPVSPKGGRGGGIELVICVGSKGIYIGQTLAIQDYEGYSLRDYGRPSRDDKSGMIPPKLAKIMINLAGKSKDNLLLDPFCGSGTILQEMVLLGYKNVIGADVEDKAVNDSRANLEWLKTGLSRHSGTPPVVGDFVSRNDTKTKLIKSDVRTLSSKISYKTVDAIVTEPFLGSAKIKSFDLGKIKKEIKNLEELYLSAFEEFKKILKDSGVIVIIFPVFRFKNQFFNLEILEAVKKKGFIQKDFIEQKIKGEDLLKLQIADRDSIIYFRPGQTVSREIFVFKNNRL